MIILFYAVLVAGAIVGIVGSTTFGRNTRVSSIYQGLSENLVKGTPAEELAKSYFWILYPFVVAIAIYFPVYYFFDTELSYRAWQLVPIFWFLVFLWLILLGRLSLVNVANYLKAISSIALAAIYLQRIFKIGPSRILPDDSDVVFQFWILAVTYSFIAINRFSDTEDLRTQRRKKYYEKKCLKFCEKFAAQLKSCNAIEKTLILSILVKENFERPKVIRVFEKIFRSKTTGIAQVQGNYSDKESVVKCASIVKDSVAEFYSDDQNEGITGSLLTDFVSIRYNGDRQYSEDLWEIYLVISETVCWQEKKARSDE